MGTEASTVVGTPRDSKVNLGLDSNRQPPTLGNSQELASQEGDGADAEKASRHSANLEPARNDSHSSGPSDPNIVSWDGPDDPENPMNWSAKKKFANVATVSVITFITYVYLPFLCFVFGLTLCIDRWRLPCSLRVSQRL